MNGNGQGTAPDQIENCPHPRNVQTLFGHELAEQSFLNSMKAEKLHHAWLIQGPKGAGKATLAYRMARRLSGATPDAANGLLGCVPEDHISRQISAGSYPDLKVTTNSWNEKTKKWRNEISVDQIREIGHMFANQAAGNGWRVCIVDCVDDLNRNAANALLKTLEEPPKRGLLILISHQPGRLLTTITSRCRRLKLRAPGASITKRIAMECGANEEDALFAAKLSAGCPGRALQIINTKGAGNQDGGLWAVIDRFFYEFPNLNHVKLHDLANKLSQKKAAQSLDLFLSLLQVRLEQKIRQLANSGETHAITPWFKAVEENQVLQNDLTRINLDPAMVIHQLLQNIQRASRLASQIKESPNAG